MRPNPLVDACIRDGIALKRFVESCFVNEMSASKKLSVRSIRFRLLYSAFVSMGVM